MITQKIKKNVKFAKIFKNTADGWEKLELQTNDKFRLSTYDVLGGVPKTNNYQHIISKIADNENKLQWKKVDPPKLKHLKYIRYSDKADGYYRVTGVDITHYQAAQTRTYIIRKRGTVLEINDIYSYNELEGQTHQEKFDAAMDKLRDDRFENAAQHWKAFDKHAQAASGINLDADEVIFLGTQ